MTAKGDVAEIQGTFLYPNDMPTHLPRTEEELVIKFNDTTIFGGVVEEVEFEVLGQNQALVTVRCRDYTKWLDGKLVSGVFTQSKADDMVKAIVQSVTSSFDVSGVNAPLDILPKVSIPFRG